jgi:hypothetical protein
MADSGVVVHGRANNVNSPIARADAPLWPGGAGRPLRSEDRRGGRLLRFGFGGGSGGVFLAAKHRPLPPFRKGNFVLGQIVERPDHRCSWWMAWGCRLVRRTALVSAPAGSRWRR